MTVEEKEAATKQKAVQLLKDALELMNNSGAHWTKGDYSDQHPVTGETRYCSVGALDQASCKLGYEEGEFGRVEEMALESLAVGLTTPRGWNTEVRVTSWNDQPKRKWEDIVKRFTGAIARLEKK